ncbi:hypothetical protein FRIGORI9N_270094 [Frigoribacterium sp. 9N]|nr:hypothetical protein FRIGORI9N_270094 [Frigoribacterium sp. 9N]
MGAELHRRPLRQPLRCLGPFRRQQLVLIRRTALDLGGRCYAGRHAPQQPLPSLARPA